MNLGPEHPTPPRPRPAEVAPAMAAAVATSGSTAELQRIVRGYVRELKRAGVPPERALLEVKELLGLSKVRVAYGPYQMPLERLAAHALEWFVAEYYGPVGR